MLGIRVQPHLSGPQSYLVISVIWEKIRNSHITDIYSLFTIFNQISRLYCLKHPLSCLSQDIWITVDVLYQELEGYVAFVSITEALMTHSACIINL